MHPLRLCSAMPMATFLVVALATCDRTYADDGFDASLHVSDAQFFRERMPDEESGPRVRTVTVGSSFAAGSIDRSCSGELDRESTAVGIALAGDVGFWILRADAPTASALDAPTFDAKLSFSSTMRAGPRDLVVRGVDAQRRFGPPLVRTIDIRDRVVPEGQLVVSLSWDNGADLDLHVVDPNGTEVFKRNPGSYEPPAPGAPRPPPGAIDGGVLDFDSNAACVEDGRRAENVSWRNEPPTGRYVARVDTMSLCGEPVARWRVQAMLRGVVIGTASGIATETDTRFSHGRGAGVLALEIDVAGP